MRLKKIIYRIVPLQTFVSLRAAYRKALKAWYQPLSENKFREILTQRLQIKKGSVVFIHSSMDALHIRFSAARLLDILLETVGEQGTLLFPAWHFTERAEVHLAKKKIFDAARDPSVMGLLSEIARRHPAAVRSGHPTNSIVAIGKDAEELVREHEHSIYPCGESSPFYRLIEHDGLIAGIGVDNDFISFVHCPEDVMKKAFPLKTRLDTVFDATVKLPDGSLQTVQTLTAHPQVVHNDIPAYMKRYIPEDTCRNITVRGNRFFIARSKELFDAMTSLAEKGITIYTGKATIKNKKDD